MASRVPHALEMRRLKYDEATDAERAEARAALEERGRRSEILLLLEQHRDPAAIEKERDWAVAQGDGFHLASVRRLGGAVEERHWRELATNAEQRGRWMDARQAWLALGDDERLQAIADHLPPSLRPPPPASPPSP